MIAWPAGPSVPVLSPNEVHVWAVPLAVASERLAELLDLLDDEERQRAARYGHEPSRQQFIVSRAMLRTLLGRYLGQAPQTIRLASGPQGKPVLPSPEGVYFNVSHTQGLALIAIARLGEVGIDVEQARHCPTYLDMAERFFTPAEAAALRSLPEGRRIEAFFHVWTRKEAFLKALGLGLAHGLERFEVAVPPSEPVRILHIDGDPVAGARWSLLELAPARGYVGALAIETPEPSVRCWAVRA
jgi:4'-phosphopantetheinyl transferase